MWYKKFLRFATQYRWALGLILLGTLGLIGWLWSRTPQGLEVTTELMATPAPNRIDTDLIIQEASLAGKLLGVVDQTIFALDPETLERQDLVHGVAFRSPQQLTDGRLAAFYQKAETGKSNWSLLLQKQNRFEEIPLPSLATKDSPFSSQVPGLDPLGQYVVYIDLKSEQESGVARPAVVRYSLTDFKAEVLTKAKVLAAKDIFISPDGQWIGFSYQKVTNNQLDSVTSVGLIPSASQTVNLFPQIQIEGDLVRFAPDSQYLLYQDKEGFSTFSITEGMVVDSLVKRKLVGLTDTLVGVSTAPEPIAALLKDCATPGTTTGFDSVEWYRLGPNGFNKAATTERKNTVFAIAGLTAKPREPWVTHIYTPKACEGTWGFWDFGKRTVVDLKVPVTSELH